MWPGIISLKEFAIPIMGLCISSFVKPIAYNNDLWGALTTPF